MGTLLLRAALKRGLLIAAANWPLVLLDFVFESVYKLALAIPILGGALMVAAIVGTDLRMVVAEGLFATANQVLASVLTAPVALASFLTALALVAFGGEAIMFALKAGTLATLIAAEQRADDGLHRRPVGLDSFQGMSAFQLESVAARVRHFGRRAVNMALWLAVAYFVVGLSYLAVWASGGWQTPGSGVGGAWPLLVLLSTSGVVLLSSVADLAHGLLRVIVINDDCTVRVALGRLAQFVIEDARQVVGIFIVMVAVQMVATVASLLAAGGLGLIAVMPFVGLLIVPLQLAAWLVRALLFQYLSSAALIAYQAQYRRFAVVRYARP